MIYICQLRSGHWDAISTMEYPVSANTCVIRAKGKCTGWDSARGVSAATKATSKQLFFDLLNFVNGIWQKKMLALNVENWNGVRLYIGHHSVS